ncbi:MAG: amino acid ABC transporter permease [Pseudomonadota bacterium]
MDDAQPFVRREFVPASPAPAGERGIGHWAKKNLFSSPLNVILTLIGLFLLYLILSPLATFAFVDAIWAGEDGAACRSGTRGELEAGTHIGACWAMVKAKFAQYIYFQYPLEERWRVDITGLAFFGLLIPLLIPAVPFKQLNAILFLIVFPIFAFIMLYGGSFGLPVVETPLWGGLLVTLVIATVGIVASLPLGVLFALGRQSNMPLIRSVSIAFIEFWRGIPLITVLFMSSVMLPLFLPEGVTFDKLLRALIGVALFSSAYMAEVIRGGLQAIPKGQYEGAQALGLSYWKTMRLIILPQAIKHVIPGIVNSFIALFKDTTLVLIIGMFDLLGAIQTSFTDSKWASPTQDETGYLFAAAIFWAFCYAMSRYSIFMENKLHTGHKR